MREIIVGTHVTEEEVWLGIVLFAQNGDKEMW
jgi:hypothetical protein